MATGLTCELLTADQHLSLPVDERLETFEHMARAIGDIFDEAQQLHEAFRRIEQSPVNLRLQAVRCEDPGRTDRRDCFQLQPFGTGCSRVCRSV